jgi:hypothetical protein
MLPKAGKISAMHNENTTKNWHSCSRFEINTRIQPDHTRMMMRTINMRAFTPPGEENSVQMLNCFNPSFAQNLGKIIH